MSDQFSINAWEASLFILIQRELPPQERDKLSGQIDKITSLKRDEMGQLMFTISGEAVPFGVTDAFPILLWYFDTDGWLVNMALHLDAKGNLLRLERYRVDGRPIELLWPRLDQVRLQLSTGDPHTFDAALGWK